MKISTFISALALCVLLAAPAVAQEVIPPTTATKPAAAPAAVKPAALKPAAGSASASTAPAKTYGDWAMVCPKGMCMLKQRVMAKGKDGKQVPGIIALSGSSKLKNKEGKQVNVPYVRLISPLGAFLPNGVGYKLDDGKEGTTPFLFCEPDGCMAELRLNSELVDKLKAGKKLQVSYSTLDTKTPRRVNVSLNGLAQGLAAIASK